MHLFFSFYCLVCIWCELGVFRGFFFQLGVFSFPLMSDGRGAVLSIKASAHPHGPCANSNRYLLLT